MTAKRNQQTAVLYGLLLLSLHVPSIAIRDVMQGGISKEAPSMAGASGSSDLAGAASRLESEAVAVAVAVANQSSETNQSEVVAVSERAERVSKKHEGERQLVVIGHHFQDLTQPGPKVSSRISDALTLIGLGKKAATIAGVTLKGTAAAFGTYALAFVGGAVSAWNGAVTVHDLATNADSKRNCEIAQDLGGLTISAVGIGLTIASLCTGGTALAVAGVVAGVGSIAARHGMFDSFCTDADRAIRQCMNGGQSMANCERELEQKVKTNVDRSSWREGGRDVYGEEKKFYEAKLYCQYSRVEEKALKIPQENAGPSSGPGGFSSGGRGKNYVSDKDTSKVYRGRGNAGA